MFLLLGLLLLRLVPLGLFGMEAVASSEAAAMTSREAATPAQPAALIAATSSDATKKTPRQFYVSRCLHL